MKTTRVPFGILLTAIAVCLLAVGCSNDKGLQFEFVEEPVISGNPNASTPLVAVLEYSTNTGSEATVTVSDGNRTFDVPTPEHGGNTHRITLLNLRPGIMHSIHLEVRRVNGQQLEPLRADLTYETAPLPEDFPDIIANIPRPDLMEPGVTLFSLIEWTPYPYYLEYDENGDPVGDPLFWNSAITASGMLVIVDEEGEVIWYHETNKPIWDSRRLQNGNLLYIMGDFEIVEIDMEGNIVHDYFAAARNTNVPEGAIAVPVDTFHHEAFEMPNEHILALSTELRMLPEYPTSEVDPLAPPSAEPVPVVGDVVVEFDKNGNVLNTWHLMDIVDPYIIGYDSLTQGYWWRAPYEEHIVIEGGAALDGPKDWSHSNGVIYDAEDDTILISSRHLDSIIKISHETDELIWIIGDHDGWTEPFEQYLLAPQGALDWQYHQHAPMLTADGDVLLYDNGNYRAKPFIEYFDPLGNPLPNPTPATETFSRAVIYSVDEEAMTVSQQWESLGDYYAWFICDANEMSGTGNILIDHGGQIQSASYDDFDRQYFNKRAHIKEVTRDTDETVFELFISSQDPWIPNFGATRTDWSSYRAERLPSIFPEE